MDINTHRYHSVQNLETPTHDYCRVNFQNTVLEISSHDTCYIDGKCSHKTLLLKLNKIYHVVYLYAQPEASASTDNRNVR